MPETILTRWTDHDDDSGRLFVSAGGYLALQVRQSGAAEDQATVNLTRDQAAELAHALTEWVQTEGPTGCDREKCCGDADGCSPVTQASEPLDVRGLEAFEAELADYVPPITDEAYSLVYGSRQDEYAHPRQNFTRTAILWHGVLLDKLADGESITPEDVALCMVQVKVAREAHQPARDNRVDGAGYFLCLDRLETGR